MDTTTSKDPIVGLVFDAKGLIADISLKGAKFSKIDKKNRLYARPPILNAVSGFVFLELILN